MTLFMAPNTTSAIAVGWSLFAEIRWLDYRHPTPEKRQLISEPREPMRLGQVVPQIRTAA
jgi:hypothetical protein